MFDVNDILARLQNGEDAQTIANEFADKVNQANKMYADQKAKEAKENAEKAKKEQLNAILADFYDWFNHYYPELSTEEESIDAEQVIELVEGLKDLVGAFKPLTGNINTKKVSKVNKAVSADEALTAFLKDMGW